MAKKAREEDLKSKYGPAARRRKKNKRRAIRICLMLGVILVCVIVSLSLTVFFKSTSIVVMGQDVYSNDNIIAKSGISLGDNVFRINSKKVKERLIAEFPYIEDVSLQRDFQGTVIIKITQAEPFLTLEQTGTYSIVSQKGRILEQKGFLDNQGIRLIGVETENLFAGDYIPEYELDKLAILSEILTAIEEHSLSRISLIDVSDQLDINMLYNGKVVVLFGTKLDIDYKIRALKNIIDLSVDYTTVGVIDVATKPIMRLRDMDIFDEEIWPFDLYLLEDYKINV